MSEKRIENYTLWQEYKDLQNSQAHQELIIKYLDLVKYQVGRIKVVVPDFIAEEDLEGYGILGLIDAINKFDYQQGFEFTTYASRRIRGEILDHLRKLDWLPHSQRREAKRLKQTAANLANKYGRQPTKSELAEELDISLEKVNQLDYLVHSANWVSLFAESGEETSLIDFLPAENSQQPDQQLQLKEREKLLIDALERLSETEKLVISLYYYEELTQKEIARVMDLSPARISQLHKKAIYRLRGFLSRKKEQFID